MNTLSYKFKILNTLNYEYIEIKNILKEVVYVGFNVTNEVISSFHNYNVEIQKYYILNGSYPKKGYLLEGYNSFRTMVSNKYKDRLSILGVMSDQYAGITENAIKMYTAKSKDIKSGKSVIPQVKKKSIEINFRARSTNIKDNVVTISLLNLEKAKELNPNTKNGKVSFVVDLGKNGHGKKLLDKLSDDTSGWKLCDSCIKTDGEGNYYIKLAYQVPTENNQKLDSERILGVDLGIANAAVMTISDKPVNLFINGGEIEAFRRRIEGRRKKLRNQLKVCSDNRKGHGKKTFLAPLDSISTKIANFKNLTNHRYAKKIVDFAEKHHCGIIQMENLEGIGKKDSFLAKWSYYDLQQKVKYKAELRGIEFVKVESKYTSQRCNVCGHIAKENRTNQATFKCVSCGHKTNADLNAAKNLAIKDIDKIIKQTLHSNKKELHRTVV